jgi:uncharacterized damage-inducible protein DinB
MTPATVLTDAFGRVLETALAAVDGLDDDALAVRPTPEANSIAWLVWHLTRIQDDHVAEVAGREQVWTSQGYAERFGLPFDDAATGYGFSADDVAAVRADADLLAAYLRAVHAATVDFLLGVTEDDLDRVVDRRWEPPVTLGVRLVSVISDDLQHAGQAAYVRGLR